LLDYLTVAGIEFTFIAAVTDADVAQSVERRLGKAEVTGSIPVISFFFAVKSIIKAAPMLLSGFYNTLL
jgi:hypothetical protein